MAQALFKETRYEVGHLIDDIRRGRLALPELQRPFVWRKPKVRDLLDSMYRGYPVGYLLLWSTGDEISTKHIGTDGKQDTPVNFIVDGQQRLTSLFAVMTGAPVLTSEFKRERIRIAFRPRDGRFGVADAATDKDPEFMADVSVLWTKSEWQAANEFMERLRNSREVSHDEEVQLRQAISDLHGLEKYVFVANEIKGDANDEQVAEIFLRINSGATQLTQADFILTLMSVFREDDRRRLEEFARRAREPSTDGPSPFNHIVQPSPDQLLRVAVLHAFQRGRLQSVTALLRGGSIDTGLAATASERDTQFDKLGTAITDALDLSTWHEFLKLLPAAGIYRGREISSANNVVFVYALFLIGRRRFGLSYGQLRVPIARYFFMSSLTGRYTGSFETQITLDARQLCEAASGDAFLDRLNAVVDTTLTADFWSIALPQALATSAARSPELFAYGAALCLLDARLPFTASGHPLRLRQLLDPTIAPPKAPIERHHLFPRGYLATLGITTPTQTNQIANMAYVEWPDNIAISDTPPDEYWPRYRDRFTDDDLEHHALYEDWDTSAYSDFLVERRRRIAGVIQRGFEAIGRPI